MYFTFQEKLLNDFFRVSYIFIFFSEKYYVISLNFVVLG